MIGLDTIAPWNEISGSIHTKLKWVNFRKCAVEFQSKLLFVIFKEQLDVCRYFIIMQDFR